MKGSYWALRSCGTVYHAVQGCSNKERLLILSFIYVQTPSLLTSYYTQKKKQGKVVLSLALIPSTACVIWRVLHSRLCSQILQFTTIQIFQYNLLISALFSIPQEWASLVVKGRKVLCINSYYLVKDSKKNAQFWKAAVLHFHSLLMKSFSHRLKTVFHSHM